MERIVRGIDDILPNEFMLQRCTFLYFIVDRMRVLDVKPSLNHLCPLLVAFKRIPMKVRELFHGELDVTKTNRVLT